MQPSTTFHDFKIFVLEDDSGDFELINYNLRRAGIAADQIIHAKNLRDARNILSAHNFDVIFIDLHVEDCSGINTFREIKEAACDAPVVILSGMNDDELANAAVREGAQDYIQKNELDYRNLIKIITYSIEREKLTHRLKIAEEVARAHSEEKSKFMAQLSHEIRTPMNGVIGMTSLLLETKLDNDQRDMLHTIKSCGQNLVNLISEILEFSKMEAGKIELQEAEFNLRELVEDTIELFAETSQQKDVLVADIIAPEIPSQLVGDPGRLRQILTNLVGNALKFTPKGYVKINVQVEGKSTDDITLRFEIKDTGSGISQEHIAKLFKPFVQVPNAASDATNGTGLGLVISQKLSRLMGGNIGVMSEEGKGSTFWFTVQLRYQSQKKNPRPSLTNTRALIVSANMNYVEILKQQLTLRNLYSIDSAKITDATEFLKNAYNNNRAVDFILIADNDINNEELKNFIAEVRSHRLFYQLPVLLVISRSHALLLEGDLKNEIADIIHLPIRQADLYRKIAGLFSNSQVHGKTETSKLVAAAAPSSTTPKAPRAKQGHRILVVDDNIVNRKVATKTLELLGYDVTTANDGSDAISLARQTQFSVILMDCKMPGIDGWEATKQIRQSEKGDRTPIIALTAGGLEEERQRCFSAGMDDFMTKPVTVDQIESVLIKWLKAGLKKIS